MIQVNTSVVSGVALSEIDGELKILLMKRAKEGFWCHVAGKIEGEEAGWQAIIREFAEETGIKVTQLYNAEYSEQFYEPEKDRFMIIPSFVVWCEPDQVVTLNPEHTEYRWCTLQQALELVPFPNQEKYYQHIWQYFVDKAPSDFMQIKLP
ncbi:NUDIX hydrolase [Endozoicomonadaceae bacterium StTr2]